MKRNKVRRVLFVVGMVLIGLVAAEILGIIRARRFRLTVDDIVGLERSGANVFFQPPMSPTGVREDALDTTGDGKINKWIVTVRVEDPPSFQISIVDNDSDGIPDEYWASLAKPETAIAFLDGDKDGRADCYGVSLVGQDGKGFRYRYQDYNLDGVLDTMVQYAGDEILAWWIRADYMWLRASASLHTRRPQRALVFLEEDRGVFFDFIDGEWQLSEEAPDLSEWATVPRVPAFPDLGEFEGGDPEEHSDSEQGDEVQGSSN